MHIVCTYCTSDVTAQGGSKNVHLWTCYNFTTVRHVFT